MVMNTLAWMTFAPMALGIIGLFLPNLLKKILGVFLLAGNLYWAVSLFTRPPADTAIFAMDPLSRVMILFIGLLGLMIYCYTLQNTSKASEGKSLTLILWSTGLATGTVAGGNMIALVVFWGISGLMLYFYGLLNSAGAAAAKKTFLMMGVSDVLLIIGLALLWSNNGGSYALYSSALNVSDFWSYLAFFCLLLAAFTKAGGFPMHTWIPAFSRSAPIEGVALLPGVLDKLLGIYLLARIMNGLFVLPFILNLIVMVLGAITIVTAAMMALIQHNGRNLLGYCAVSQVGYMILGLGTSTPLGIIGGLFQLINCVIYQANLFLSLGSVEKRTGTSELDKNGGLAVHMPLTFISSLAGALAITGIPPFNGFGAKWMIYQSLISNVGVQPIGLQLVYVLCLIIAVFGSGLTLASMMKFLYTLYFGKSRQDFSQVKEISINNWLVTIALAALCLILGVFAYPLVINGLLSFVGGRGIAVTAVFPGFYQPYLVFGFLLAGFVIAFLGYLIFRKVRFDQNYVGGQADTHQFAADGSHFYNDIRLMHPLKTMYDLALKKAFDIYDLTGKLAGRTGIWIQKAHTGVLTTYVTWVVVGFIVVILMLLGIH
jgi:formate hydrogenlyase subunit 3/multisubunit Na+/H+ antiporter MnhD subunit